MSYISICFHCYVIAQQLLSLTLVVRFVVANILIAKFIAGLGALLILRTITVMTRVSHLSFTDELCIHFIAIITVRGIIRSVMGGCRCSMHHRHEVHQCCEVQLSVHLFTSNMAGVCCV